jgi:serine protease AprX
MGLGGFIGGRLRSDVGRGEPREDKTMSTAANRTRGAVPTRMAAAIAALSLLAMPVPAGAQGSGRTVLLTLTEGASLTQLADTVIALGGRVLNTLELSDSLLVELPTGVGAPAGSAEIPDTPMKVNGTRTVSYPVTIPTYRDTIGIPSDSNYGEGVTIALVDTGVALDANGLDHVTPVEVPGVDDTGDGFGHGTFLAGIIGGRGIYKGVAPAADLLDVKVADDEGNTSLSLVLAGLDAVADRGDVDVVNISLSTKNPLPAGLDPLARALEDLWAQGVTVVAAAGNGGPNPGTVGSPGNDPVLLTVGALDEIASIQREGDAVADFSSRGGKDLRSKPDLVAPGVSLVSTGAPGSVAVVDNEGWAELGNGYMRGSGTSMSAAVVTGAVAAVLGVRETLKPNGVKALLTGTTYELADSDGAGSGALDLGAAITAAPTADIDPSQDLPRPKHGAWGPDEQDAEEWAAFADAWQSDAPFDVVKAAWDELSWQTQQWATRAWALAVVANSLGLDEEEFLSRSWSSRSWSIDEWLSRSWSSRSWSSRSWSSRSWSYEEWLSRSWSSRSWSSRSWSSRSWSDLVWESRSWSSRSWSSRSWSMTA